MVKQKQRRVKRVPQRTCVACRAKFDKRRLTRVVRTAEDVVVDQTGKANGRGAYLCDSAACWQDAIARNMLNAALKTKLSERQKAAILAAGPAQNTPAA